MEADIPSIEELKKLRLPQEELQQVIKNEAEIITQLHEKSFYYMQLQAADGTKFYGRKPSDIVRRQMAVPEIASKIARMPVLPVSGEIRFGLANQLHAWHLESNYTSNLFIISEMYEAKRCNTDSRFICPMVSRGDIDIFVGDVVFYQYPGNPIPHGLGLVLKIYKRVSFIDV